MVCFSIRKEFTTVKRLLGITRCHIEPMRGTSYESYLYCSKEETRDTNAGFDPIEFGTIPDVTEKTKKPRLGDFVGHLIMGGTVETGAERYPEIFVRNFRGLTALENIQAKPRQFKPLVYWIYGSSGTGKSAWAHKYATRPYWKNGQSKWWDGYNPNYHDSVIIDDYRRDMCHYCQILTLFDRYPNRIEYKGGSCEFTASRIFVTTPKSPDATWGQWCHDNGDSITQLNRRIDFLLNFDFCKNYVMNEDGNVVFLPMLDENEENKLIEER
jgi:hypothetical protein